MNKNKNILNDFYSDNNEHTDFGVVALERRRREVKAQQELMSKKRSAWIKGRSYFYKLVGDVFSHIVEPKKNVLNIRCDNGWGLAAVNPSHGIGVELTEGLAAEAAKDFPENEYIVGCAEDLKFNETFDYIILNGIGETVDVVKAFKNMHGHCKEHSRLVIYSYNNLWEPIVSIAESLGLKMKQADQNWLSPFDVRSFLVHGDFELLKTYRVVLFPYYIPLISYFINKIVARMPLINRLCLVNIFVAKPVFEPKPEKDLSVSIIIPCKNEKGNIEIAIDRIPEMGRFTEIIFCNDKSTDGTDEEIRRMQRLHPNKKIRLVEGPGICKARNVWTGFEAAQGDVLMILDADLTVMPEELPHFFEAIYKGRADFINGSRLVYPVPRNAMKISNMLGNKGFSMIFSFLLNQRVKDTLCGTKVLRRTDWLRVQKYVGTWGIEDRWGDYDLLLGAGKINLKIIDLPVHYQERVYGVTKMVRVFQNGLIMLRICIAGFFKIKMSY